MGPLVLGDAPFAALLPRKALLPDLDQLLPRSRRRGIEIVGATPRQQFKPKEQTYVSQSRYPDRLYGAVAGLECCALTQLFLGRVSPTRDGVIG